jgi:hypothetical protein
MHWYRFRRDLRRLACALTLVLAAGCGSGHNPVEPGGGGGNDGGGNGGGGNGGGPIGGGNEGIAGEYQLVNYGGRVSLPIELQIESCPAVTFTGGGLTIYDNTTWYLTLDYTDANGADYLEDEGSLVQNGTALSFTSADYGDSFQGSVDGRVVKFDYDWCPDGQSDMQPWFAK